jgi:hypothetical protein
MCTCKDCKGITLLKGTNGVGIVSITDNENGTFTILMSDGSTFLSPNYTGPTGATGATGVSGTNAFKFIKDFESTLDGGTLTITQEELTSCSMVPPGCLFNDVADGWTNLHVQVWLRDNDPSPSGPWFLADSTNSNILIDDTTGTITVNLTGGSILVLARIVVIA